MNITFEQRDVYPNRKTYAVYNGEGELKEYLGFAEYENTGKFGVHSYWYKNHDLNGKPDATAHTQKGLAIKIEEYLKEREEKEKRLSAAEKKWFAEQANKVTISFTQAELKLTIDIVESLSYSSTDGKNRNKLIKKLKEHLK